MNTIFTLHPYKFRGQWVFDDTSRGLFREAFVAGIDKMLDALTNEIPGRDAGIILLFSSTAFPTYEVRLEWLREEAQGNWYRWNEMDGWLCPALFKYFDETPKTIYAQVKECR